MPINEPQRRRAYDKIVQAVVSAGPMNHTTPTLRAAIDAAHDWFETNRGTLNAALPAIIAPNGTRRRPYEWWVIIALASEWTDTHSVSFNQALPQPFKRDANRPQKAALLWSVIMALDEIRS